MIETFTPHNDLETRLVSLQEGRLDGNAFMQTLLDEQLFMPVEDEKNEIEGFQTSAKAKPLTLETEDGHTVLILFTSPDRAKPFVANVPGYNGGLLAEVSWILARVGSGIGIAINPGHEVGLDLDEDMVTQLIHLNAERSTDGQTSA
jgi:hypothetical protein